MTTGPNKENRVSELFNKVIHWEVDADRFLWLKGSSSDTLQIKINSSFPDGHAYSLILEDGTVYEFDDFPKTWSRGPLKWPDSAKR